MKNKEGEICFTTEKIAEAIREGFKERLQGSEEPSRPTTEQTEGKYDKELLKYIT